MHLDFLLAFSYPPAMCVTQTVARRGVDGRDPGGPVRWQSGYYASLRLRRLRAIPTSPTRPVPNSHALAGSGVVANVASKFRSNTLALQPEPHWFTPRPE